MQDVQNLPNPDVNSVDYGNPDHEQDPRDIQDLPDGDVEGQPIPVPPGEDVPYPVGDPPMEGDVPLGDVDDSTEQIANG